MVLAASLAAPLLVGVPSGGAAQSAAGESIGRAARVPQERGKKSAPARLEPFLGTLEDARKEAKERNVPVVVFVVLDGEPQNREFSERIVPDPEVAAVCTQTVVLLSNNGEHPSKQVEEVVDGKKTTREVCSVFGVPKCDDHRRLWDPVFLAWNDKGELKCPQVIVVAPDGQLKKRVRPGEVPSVQNVTTAVDAVKTEAGPGLTREQLALVKARLADGARQIDSDPADAWRSFQVVLATNDKVSWAAQAREGQAKALELLGAEREAAAARIADGGVVAGYGALVMLAERCKGLPIEKDLKKQIDKVESDKATKEVIAKYKRELAAEALWTEARELESQGQDKKAETRIRTLLRKFGDTPAGERARKTWPDIAKDEDAKRGG